MTYFYVILFISLTGFDLPLVAFMILPCYIINSGNSRGCSCGNIIINNYSLPLWVTCERMTAHKLKSLIRCMVIHNYWDGGQSGRLSITLLFFRQAAFRSNSICKTLTSNGSTLHHWITPSWPRLHFNKAFFFFFLQAQSERQKFCPLWLCVKVGGWLKDGNKGRVKEVSNGIRWVVRHMPLEINGKNDAHCFRCPCNERN